MEYYFQIMYKAGKEMPADFLSRNVLASIDVFTPDLPRLQERDKFIANVKTYMLTQQLPTNKQKALHVRKVEQECFFENNIVWHNESSMDT